MPYRFGAVSEPLPSSSAWRTAGEGLLVFLLHSAATLVCLRPIHRLWRQHLAPDLGDPLFNTYVLDWTGERWRHGLAGLWDANLFFPLDGSLALSDHLISPALLTLPLAELTGSPVAAYNLLLFLSFPLAGVLAHLVLRAGGAGGPAAFVAATFYAFSHFRWSHASHLQLLFAPLVPVVLWTFDRLLAKPTGRRAAAFAAAYAMHVTGGTYLAYMIHLALAALLANRAFGAPGWRGWLSRRRLALLAATAGFCAAVAVAVFVPYAELAHRLDLERGAHEHRRFGAHALSLLTPSHLSPLFAHVEPSLRPLAPRHPGAGWFAERALFPGFLPTLLAALGAWLVWRRGHRRPQPPLGGGRRTTLLLLLAVAAAAVVAADLHTLGWWPSDATGWHQRPDAVYTRLGVVAVVASLAGYLLRRRWGGRSFDRAALTPWHRGLLLVGVVSLALCFPVVFVPLSHLVPGLSGLRVPSRFFAIASFPLAALVACGAGRLLARVPRRGRAAVAALLAGVVCFELAPQRLSWHWLPEKAQFPPLYHWLAAEGDGPILELPFHDGHRELPYVYYSTLHRRPLVNGYSGYEPPTYRRLREICCWPVPDEAALAELRRLGVSALVVHPVWEQRWAHRSYEEWLARVHGGGIPGVREVYAGPGGSRVFALDPRRDGG